MTIAINCNYWGGLQIVNVQDTRFASRDALPFSLKRPLSEIANLRREVPLSLSLDRISGHDRPSSSKAKIPREVNFSGKWEGPKIPYFLPFFTLDLVVPGLISSYHTTRA